MLGVSRNMLKNLLIEDAGITRVELQNEGRVLLSG